MKLCLMSRSDPQQVEVWRDAEGHATGVMYLLLKPASQSSFKDLDLEEPCWEALKLHGGRYDDGVEGEVCCVREEWLLMDVKELG